MIPVHFLDDMMRLKLVPRSGWISYRINKHDIETVASHSYSVATIALVMSETMRLQDQKIDEEQVLKMALLHDLSESLTFDISKAYLRYLGRRGSQMKADLERRAISNILGGLRNEGLARVLRTTFEEYSASRSIEARIVHCADAADLLLQIVEYERMGYSKSTLDPIWNETRARLLHGEIPLGRAWARGLERIRRRQKRRQKAAMA